MAGLSLKQQAALVAEFEPVLWLHEREAFLPVDASAILTVADLFRPRSEQGARLGSLDDLPRNKDSEGCYLKLRELDNLRFLVPSDKRVDGQIGPAGVAALARELYGRPLGSSAVLAKPKYYARVTSLGLSPRPGNARDKVIRARFTDVFDRTWLRLEYFFFYVYNDSWNQHQADWDGQVELFVDPQTRALRYAIFRFHLDAWVTRVVPSGELDLLAWLAEWTAIEDDDASASVVGRCFQADGHPFVFVAQGAHGAYPTPGFTIHGRDLPGDDFLANTDERKLTGACIRARALSSSGLGKLLSDAGLSGGTIRPWDDSEVVLAPKPTQQWLKYRGRWGQPAAFLGWGGPSNPPITQSPFSLEHDYLLPELLHSTLMHGYRGGDPLGGPLGRPVLNWHGI